jgi:hypothetical protein
MSDSARPVVDPTMSNETLVKTLDACIHLYSARIQDTVENGGEPFAPLTSTGEATATDVVITTRNMLKVFEIAPFELGMLAYGAMR